VPAGDAAAKRLSNKGLRGTQGASGEIGTVNPG
jgi:hypothetical protein